jgi:signal transduction histidine kinase
MYKDEIIRQQLRLQDLLISISTKYINADLSDIDNLVTKSLKQIGEFVFADRSYIFSYDFVNNTASNTHEWCANGITNEIDNSQNIPIDFISSLLDKHKSGKAFWVENVCLLPNDGEHGLRAILDSQGIRSLITIPMIKNKELIGFIGFDSVRKIRAYSDNEKNILFVFANMLVNVLKRKEDEIRIKEQDHKKEELLKDLSLQNEELNDYAKAVSHDFKAPLINIHTLINWFINDNEEALGERVLSPLKEVLFNVEKMDFLIKGILEYSSIEKSELEDRPINLNFILDEVLKTILIPLNIKITVQENLPILHGNSLKFRQVFQNLIQNSIKYSDKKEGIIKVGATEKNEYFEFFVKDNGIGIKSDYFEKIFKVFTKLESASSSSGIGLSIVKKIIHSYKGSIWLESTEGIGTVFYFTILKEYSLNSGKNNRIQIV